MNIDKIKEYLQHKDDCESLRVQDWKSQNDRLVPVYGNCTCGLEQAIAELEKQEPDGEYVAMNNFKDRKIIARAKTPQEAQAKAISLGCSEPVIVFSPDQPCETCKGSGKKYDSIKALQQQDPFDMCSAGNGT